MSAEEQKVEIELQLDSVNKKQARFVSEISREVEKPPTYGNSTPRVEHIPMASVYLDREVWINWGSPSRIKVVR